MNLFVEFSISPGSRNLMGYAEIWMNGVQFGDPKDLVYFDSYIMGGLYQIYNSWEVRDDSFPKSPQQRFHYFQNKSEESANAEIDKYRVSFGTFSDPFDCWAFKEDNKANFLWRLWNPNARRSLSNYPKEVFSFQMGLIQYELFISHVDETLKRMSLS